MTLLRTVLALSATVALLLLPVLGSAIPTANADEPTDAALTPDQAAWVDRIASGIADGMVRSGGMAQSEQQAWRQRVAACLASQIASTSAIDESDNQCWGQAWRDAGLRNPDSVAWADEQATSITRDLVAAGLSESDSAAWEARLRNCLDGKAFSAGPTPVGAAECAADARQKIGLGVPAQGATPTEVEQWITRLRAAGAGETEHSEASWNRMRQCLTGQWNAGKRTLEMAAIGCLGVE